MKFPSFKRPGSAVSRPSTSSSSIPTVVSPTTIKAMNQQWQQSGLGGWNGVGVGIEKPGSRPATGQRPSTSSSVQSKIVKKLSTDKAPTTKEKKKPAEDENAVQVLKIDEEPNEEPIQEPIEQPNQEADTPKTKKKLKAKAGSMKETKSTKKAEMADVTKKSQSMKELKTTEMVVEDIDGYSDSEIEEVRKSAANSERAAVERMAFKQRIASNLGTVVGSGEEFEDQASKPIVSKPNDLNKPTVKKPNEVKSETRRTAFAAKRRSAESVDSDWSVEELNQTIKDLQRFK